MSNAQPSSSKEGSVLSGPWWFNDTAVSATEESAPQEALFRIDFEHAEPLELHLAAANYYQFWLNGEWMGYGPAQAPHGKLSVDTWALPVAKLADHNTLGIQVFWEGLFTFDHVLGTPGLYFSLSTQGREWPCHALVSAATGRRFLNRFSDQRGWAEVIDAASRVQGWPRGPWEDAEWHQPVLRHNDPKVRLEARDIKPFSSSIVEPRAVTWSGSCDLGARIPHRTMGYAANRPHRNDPPESPSRRLQEEALLPSSATDRNIGGILAQGSGPVVLEADPDGRDRTLQLDFGKEVAGLFKVQIEAPAGTVVDIGWSEGLYQSDLMNCWAESAQPDGSVPPREFCDSYQAVSYTCRGGGVEEFQALFIAALRYARIAFRAPSAGHRPITLHGLSVRTIGYPIERQGDFRCADENLNRIYEASVDTMVNSISDVYMDCPGRERSGWINDSYWAAVGLDAISGDTAFDRRFIRQFIDSQAVVAGKGMVAPNYPSETSRWGQKPITNHALFWALQAERHLRLHGDDDLKSAWLPGLRALLSALAAYRNSEGLLEDLPWDEFIDWSQYERGPVMGMSNALYALALRKLGALFGNPRWLEESEHTWNAVEEYFWDEGRQLYVDCLARDAEGVMRPGRRFSIVTNHVLLWTELPARKRADRVWHHLRNFHPLSVDRGFHRLETNLARGNVYSQMYRFDIAGRRQALDLLIRDLKETYLPLFDCGRTTCGEDLGYEHSFCHGYNGYLAHILIRHLAGIQLPEQPGGLIRIQPHPEVLPWCQARVPWMDGHVQVWWDRSRLLVSLPRGQRGELVLPHTAPQPFEGRLSSGYIPS